MREHDLQAPPAVQEGRLEDASYLRDADVSGALLAAASAGGQVRAVATEVASGALEKLRGVRPRALIWIVGRHGQARAAAELVAALAAQQHDVPGVPLTVAQYLPRWVGALDVVLVSGSDAGDPALAGAVEFALRRGALVVCDLPKEGPVAERGAAAAWLPAFGYVNPERSMVRHVAAGLAVLDVLGLPGIKLGEVADAADAALESLGPELAIAVNPAKLLARDVGAAHQAFLVFEDEVAGALARRIAQAFAEAGEPLAAAPLADALRFGPELLARAARTGASLDPVDRLFHDELIDGPLAASGPTFFGIIAAAPPGRVQVLSARLGTVNWIALAGPEPEGDTEAPTFEELVARSVATCAGGELAAAYALVSS